MTGGMRLVDALVLLQAEVERLARLSADAEQATETLAQTAVGHNGPALQNLDILTQHLNGLSTYLSGLAAMISGETMVDAWHVTADLRPDELARRLRSGASSDDGSDGSGVVELF